MFPFGAVEPLLVPLVAEVELPPVAGCSELLPLFAPPAFASAELLASAVDAGAGEGVVGAAAGAGGGDCCVPGSDAAALASRIAANDCVSVPCAVADICDLWEDWDARVALTSDAILDTAESL